jgi:mono/diheme cytochrome c family protein
MPTRSPLAKLACLVLSSALLALPWSAPARMAPPDDDDEEREFRRAEAKQAFVENCLMCHGEEMTTRQRLTPKQWSTEVEKMVNWGSPLPPERRQPLVEYLAESFPHTRAPAPIERIDPDRAGGAEPPRAFHPAGSPAANPAEGEALFARHCATCHGANARGGELGTNLVERPILIRDDDYESVVRDGRRRMPAFAAAIDARARMEILAWLRGQR